MCNLFLSFYENVKNETLGLKFSIRCTLLSRGALCISFILYCVYNNCVSSSERATVASNCCVSITACWKKDIKGYQSSGGSRGGGGGGGPGIRSHPIRPNAYLRLKFLHRQDRTLLLNWLIFFFLMKRRLYFATKLDTRDIEKCNCFGVPLASARKAVFPAPTATSVHRLKNMWSSLLSQRLVGGGVGET